jgi:hypothetical protein
MGVFQEFTSSRKPGIRKLVGVTFNQLKKRTGLIDRYFPLAQVNDFKILWLRMNNRPAIASFTGWSGEIPNTRRGDIKEDTAEVLKMGLAHEFNEEDLKLMQEFMVRARAGESGFMQTIQDMIFGRVEDLVMGNVDLAARITWEVCYSGGVSYTDPRTKVKFKLTYPTVSSHFPAALTGGNTWDTSASANGLQDLKDLAEAFYATLGFFPDETVMTRNQLNQLLAQDSTRDAAVAKTGSAASPSDLVIGRDLLNQLITDREIPPIVLMDERYETENAKGKKTQSRFLPDGYITFLTGSGAIGPNTQANEAPPDLNMMRMMGERCLGPVPSNNNQPGIYTFTEEMSKEPPLDRQVAVGTFVPAVYDPRLLAGLKVA